MLKLSKGKVIVTPVCKNECLLSHREYLRKRIRNINPGYDSSHLVKRIKYLNTDRLDITIPVKIKKDVRFIRELDYFMNFLKNCHLPVKKIKFGNQTKYIPEVYVNYLLENINIFPVLSVFLIS